MRRDCRGGVTRCGTSRRSRLAHCYGHAHVESIERLQPAPWRGLPRRHEASGRPDPSGRHGGQTSGVRRSGLRHRLRTRQSLIGTRCFGAGHRREPFPPMYGYGRACLATHADHRKGQTCRSKGDNPNPTSSKAIGPRDPADVPHRERRGGAVPILTTAHDVHATTRGGYPKSLPTCVARP